MTNGEKYRTARERTEAFEAFCINRSSTCRDCQLVECRRNMNECSFAWLDLEAEDEKPLPCPFCGGESIVRSNWNSTHQVVCNSQGCWYCSKCETTESDAIAAHNRVAKMCGE